MFDRFERPVKIIGLALAALLAWQLGSLILRSDPLATMKIPALPTLPAQNETNAAGVTTNGTNGTNATIGLNAANGANAAHDTNAVKGANVVNDANVAVKSANIPAADQAVVMNAGSGPRRGGSPRSRPPEAMPGLPPGLTPEMMAAMPPEMLAQMMAGGMPGGPGGGGMNTIKLPPEVQARVDRIIDSEILGPAIRPMPMVLTAISDQGACIQATNGQTGWVKVGGEMGGIKLLRIGVNRVLVEQDGKRQELTLFGGLGGASLMPEPANAPSTNIPSTNTPSTNTPAKKASTRIAAASTASTNQTLSSKQKETQ